MSKVKEVRRGEGPGNILKIVSGGDEEGEKKRGKAQGRAWVRIKKGKRCKGNGRKILMGERLPPSQPPSALPMFCSSPSPSPLASHFI